MYYVYEYFIVDTLEVFYVGKGKGLRRFSKSARNRYFQNICKKHKVAVRIVDFFENEEDAFKAEMDRISELKAIGQARANITNGGEGTSGLEHSEESKRLMSQNRKGKCVGEKNPNFRREFSKSHREKISKSLKGKFAGQKNPMYGVRLIGDKNPFYGRKHTDETKAKISANRKGKGARYGKDNPMYGVRRVGKDNPMYGKRGFLHPNSKCYLVTYPNGESEFLTAKQCEKKFGIAFNRIRDHGGIIQYDKNCKRKIYEGTTVTLCEPVTTSRKAYLLSD